MHSAIGIVKNKPTPQARIPNWDKNPEMMMKTRILKKSFFASDQEIEIFFLTSWDLLSATRGIK